MARLINGFPAAFSYIFSCLGVHDLFDKWTGIPTAELFINQTGSLAEAIDVVLKADAGRVEAAAAVVRTFVNARVGHEIMHEITAWKNAFSTSPKVMVPIEVCQSIKLHLRRHLDSPVDRLQEDPRLFWAEVPNWYHTVFVQPALEAIFALLDEERASAMADSTQLKKYQDLAASSLSEDKRI